MPFSGAFSKPAPTQQTFAFQSVLDDVSPVCRLKFTYGKKSAPAPAFHEPVECTQDASQSLPAKETQEEPCSLLEPESQYISLASFDGGDALNDLSGMCSGVFQAPPKPAFVTLLLPREKCDMMFHSMNSVLLQASH